MAAERYSTAVGSGTSLRAVEYTIGDVGMVAGACWASAWMFSDTLSSSGVSVGWFSSSSGSAEAAISVMTASAKAGTATSDSSMRSAALTIIVPVLSNLNLVGFAPTDTESYAPALSSATASRLAAVSARVASKRSPVSVSSSLLTTPRSCVRSWFSTSLAAFWLTLNAPRTNLTFWPPETVAVTSQGTATPAIFGASFSSSAAASSSTSALNLIIRAPFRLRGGRVRVLRGRSRATRP